MGVPEAVDRLVVVADDAHLGVRRDQLEHALISFVEVLKLVHKDVRELGENRSRWVVLQVVIEERYHLADEHASVKLEPLDQIAFQRSVRRSLYVSRLVRLQPRPRRFKCLDALLHVATSAVFLSEVGAQRFHLELVEWPGCAPRRRERVRAHKHFERQAMESASFELVATRNAHTNKLAMQVFRRHSCQGDWQYR